MAFITSGRSHGAWIKKHTKVPLVQFPPPPPPSWGHTIMCDFKLSCPISIYHLASPTPHPQHPHTPTPYSARHAVIIKTTLQLLLRLPRKITKQSLLRPSRKLCLGGNNPSLSTPNQGKEGRERHLWIISFKVILSCGNPCRRRG